MAPEGVGEWNSFTGDAEGVWVAGEGETEDVMDGETAEGEAEREAGEGDDVNVPVNPKLDVSDEESDAVTDSLAVTDSVTLSVVLVDRDTDGLRLSDGTGVGVRVMECSLVGLAFGVREYEEEPEGCLECEVEGEREEERDGVGDDDGGTEDEPDTEWVPDGKLDGVAGTENDSVPDSEAVTDSVAELDSVTDSVGLGLSVADGVLDRLVEGEGVFVNDLCADGDL